MLQSGPMVNRNLEFSYKTRILPYFLFYAWRAGFSMEKSSKTCVLFVVDELILKLGFG